MLDFLTRASNFPGTSSIYVINLRSQPKIKCFKWLKQRIFKCFVDLPKETSITQQYPVMIGCLTKKIGLRLLIILDNSSRQDERFSIMFLISAIQESKQN